MKIKKSLLITVLLLVSFEISYSWDNERTHKYLSQIAAENSVLRLESVGYPSILDQKFQWNGRTLKVVDWLREGADLEDAGNLWQLATKRARSYNHFHTPLKQFPWTDAGLDDWIPLPPFHTTGQSALLWSQDGTYQENFPERNWSWLKVREHFYTSLTGRDFNDIIKASTQSQREEYFAKTFRGLGHQMHLIQDMAVPAHVRNDAHPEDSMFGIDKRNGSAYFETWAKERFRNIKELKAFASKPVFPNMSFNASYNGFAPIIQLYDNDQYDGLNASAGMNQGLAEYTNANFFSDDTIFAAERFSPDHRHYFPFPRKSSTDVQDYIAQIKPMTTQISEDGLQDKPVWIKKIGDGEQIVEHFVRTSWWTRKTYKEHGEGPLFYSSFYRDENCHEDYAKFLIPRSVGYSAELLNYFFRGNIEITLPQSAVYSVANTEAGFFNKITLLAKNVTSTGEEMSNGSVVLVAKYRVAQEDLFQSKDIVVSHDYFYSTVPEGNNVSYIPKDNPIDLTFDLGQTAIVPRNAVDVSLQVVFKGRLGNEDNAVAVGMKAISDPTPVDMVNNMDKICLYGVWYDAGSAEAIAQVDPDNNGVPNWDIYTHNIADAYVKISSLATPLSASPADYTLSFPLMQPGNLYRGYILSDMDLNHSEYATAVKTTTDDVWTHREGGLMKDIWPGTAVKAVIDIYTDAASCAEYGATAPCVIRRDPGLYTFRNMELWGPLGVIFENPEYPVGSECPWEAL